MTLNVEYLTAAEIEAYKPTADRNLLAVVSFGRERPVALEKSCPFTKIEMEPAAGSPCYEVWTTPNPVIWSVNNAIQSATDGNFLFGIIEAAEMQGVAIETVTQKAYLRLFDRVDSSSCPTVLRMWNYIPNILGDADGIERYRRFNQGRHEAFVTKRSEIHQPPAASGLGARAGKIVIYFLAGKGEPGIQIENPRQVSAYRYPEQYGPRSPTFSRAMLAPREMGGILFISGTASIVGHESRHAGDLAAQLNETVTNIRTLIAEAEPHGFTPSQHGLHLKVYIRHLERDLTTVREGVHKAFPDAKAVMYLKADICRQELLVEIEVICQPDSER